MKTHCFAALVWALERKWLWRFVAGAAAVALGLIFMASRTHGQSSCTMGSLANLRSDGRAHARVFNVLNQRLCDRQSTNSTFDLGCGDSVLGTARAQMTVTASGTSFTVNAETLSDAAGSGRTEALIDTVISMEVVGAPVVHSGIITIHKEFDGKPSETTNITLNPSGQSTSPGDRVRIPVHIRADSTGFTTFGEHVTRATLSVTLKVTSAPVPPPTTFLWAKPGGGAYNVPANWDPNCDFPQHSGTRSDTAVFALATPVGISITGSSATAGRWQLSRNRWTFSGTAEVFSTSPTAPSLTVQSGARLDLSAATFRSQSTVIDGVSFGSELHVVGGIWDNVGTVKLGRGVLQVNDSAFVRSLGPSSTDPSLAVGSDGSLLLRGGATLETVHTVLGSSVNGSLGSNATVSGDDSYWNNTGDLVIRDTTEAILKVEDGGIVDAKSLLLAENAGTTGRIEVRGIQSSGTDPSELQVQGVLQVGRLEGGGGTGSIVIEHGGFLDVGDSLYVRSGQVRVAGINGQQRSTIQTGILEIYGPVGTQLEVNDGGLLMTSDPSGIGSDSETGKAIVHNSAAGLPAYDPNLPISGAAWLASSIFVQSSSSPAELIVTDRGVVVCTNLLHVGGPNDGTLTVDNDGYVRSKVLRVGSVGGRGEAKISDGGFVGSEELTVGITSGRGEVEISAGGVLSTLLNATVGSGPDSDTRGKVVITGGIIDSAEWMVFGNLTVGGGPATGLNFLEPFKGEILLQANPIAGSFAFAGATLAVSGNLIVDTNGAVLGNGTLAVPLANRVINGGFVTPGLSPGKLTIQGNYEQTAAGRLVVEIGGLSEGQFDVLVVTGNASVNGTLEVRFLNGFLPKQGDAVDFLNLTGALSNNFAQITFPDAAPGFDAELNLMADGKLRLTARNNAVSGSGATITSPLLTIAPSLRFTQFSLTAGQLTLTWTTTPNHVYRIEAKENLNVAAWTSVTNVTATGTSLSTSFNIADAPRRFYRVAQPDAPP